MRFPCQRLPGGRAFPGNPVARGVLLSFLGILGWCAISCTAAQDDSSKKSGSGETEVVIKREALKLTDPKVYRVSMHLQPARSLPLTAPIDGWVRTVSTKPQQKVVQQAEAVRLDDR